MSRRGSRHRVAKNISRDGSGFSVRLQIGGLPIEKRFELGTPLAVMTAWRDTERKRRMDRLLAGLLPAGSFAADAAHYLSIVTALAEYDQRVYDIGLWVEVFGDRCRADIHPWEIRQVRDGWLTVGPKRVMRKAPGQAGRYEAIAAPLAPSTVALRMRALENLWSVLDGRRAPNPVREVPEPPERDAEPRGLPYAVVDYILRALPRSATRARLKVMAYTGLSQVEIKGIRRIDVDLEARTVWVRRRRKGRGGKMAAPAVQPLNSFGVAAFKEFAKTDAWGDFSTSSMWQRFQAAVRRAAADAPALGLQRLRPYDLRHSYGTAHFRASGNIQATQEALRQRSAVTTRRYVAAAIAPAMLEASQQLEALIRRERRASARPQSGARFRQRTRSGTAGARHAAAGPVPQKP